MKRRFICIILAVLILSLSGCTKKNKAAVTVDGESISEGVYAYYLDKIMSSPKEYGVDLKNKEKVEKVALSLCAESVAVSRLIRENRLSLSQLSKSSVAENTEKIWGLFGSYYESAGVRKPDINYIYTYEAGKQELLQYYFGKNGKNPVSDSDLKEAFVDMYIGIKAFEGSFTKTNVKGETVDMTEKERENLIARFRKMADRINEGADIDDVYVDYCTGQGLVATSALEVMIVKDKDPMYADDFFKKVSTISHGKAAPVTSGSSVYVVERCTIATSDADAFEEYRTVVLESMKMPAVEKKIKAKVKTLDVQTSEKITKKIYGQVSEKHA